MPSGDGFVTVQTRFPEGKVAAVVHPVQVVDDRAAVVVDLTMEEPGKSLILSNAFSVGGLSHAGGVRLVDLPGSRVWTPGTTSAGEFTATDDRVVLAPDRPVRVVTLFAVPDLERVDVMIPRVGLVEGVPVVAGDAGTPSLESLGLSGEATFPAPVSIGSYSEAYAEGVSSRSSGDEQTVTLGADVLFASDDATLSPQAGAMVDAAAASIQAAAGSGEVLVVGHTDDIASVEYNLDLSQRRAAAVAERLGPALGSGFTIRTEGKGKAEPAVPGTTTEARAANRRVEIRFSAASTPRLDMGAVPEATVPVATGNDQVEFEVKPNDSGSFSASVTQVVRRDGYLVGTVTIARVSGNGDSMFPLTLLGIDGVERQVYQHGDQAFGAWRLYLLDSSGMIFPAQHSAGDRVKAGGVRQSGTEVNPVSVLTDRSSSTASPVGIGVPWTVIWPDPGTDTISIEAPNRFRITDIPVVNG
ncbi:MAG: OmpA family protein [Micrococcales bacterium]|nr:OmpA family protein [Micrococcales bacterium]